MHTKSPGPPCGSSNLPVSRMPHQISRSPVQLTNSPDLPCGSSNLPVSHVPHQISWSPVQLTNFSDVPCGSSNLPVSCAGHQLTWSPIQVIKSPRFKRKLQFWQSGRRGGLMVSALVPRASILSSSPGRGHCIVFLGKTLNSHSASLHPGVEMGTCDFLGKPNKLWGSDRPVMD